MFIIKKLNAIKFVSAKKKCPTPQITLKFKINKLPKSSSVIYNKFDFTHMYIHTHIFGNNFPDTTNWAPITSDVMRFELRRKKKY